ncbi:uncharacterized protein LOC117344686 [Pecten maximus]|uniref:uncharacterized protein LOC117344686 n=1 Tax=Pecten maximus TaxID=6579 RepID=UPI001457FBD5|nr:uncharacterized protein LOC117344686 [Pecten maximus]
MEPRHKTVQSLPTTGYSFFKTCDEPPRRKRSTSHRRYRRALNEQDSPPKFKIVFTDDADEEPEPPSWKNGWNETSAEEACRTFIQDQKFLKKCEEVLEATANDNEEGVQSCIEDIKFTGDTRFMQSTADSLAISCRMTALKLENLTQTTTAIDTGGETILETMLNLDCRNNCSGNGVCQQGQCVCFGDFDGAECSIRPIQPPIVSPQTNPGLCKRDVYACNTFFVSGSNFADENMTCRAAHFTVTENGYNLTSVNDTFPARSVGGGFGCTCTISDALRRRKRSIDDVSDRVRRSTDENPTIAEGFFLSVSNDGSTFSDEIVVIIYDSWCQTCNTTSVSCFEFTSCITTTPSPTTTSMDPYNTTSDQTTMLQSTTTSDAATNTADSTTTTNEPTTTTTEPTTTTTQHITTTIQPTPTTTEPSTTSTEPVRCGVALRSADNIPGSVTLSESFYAGIQTDTREYVVTEGDWFDIQVRLTIPLGCYFQANSALNEINVIKEHQCTLTVRIVIGRDSSGTFCSAGGLTNEPISFGGYGCGLQFNHSNWDSALAVRVYGASDNLVNVRNREVKVRLIAEEVVIRHNAWNAASSQNISVSVVDADIRVVTSVCKSYNDPHIRTFDGRSWENQRLGEFVLYYNKDKQLSVHAMYQTCANDVPGATCNCGLAVRNKKARFVANFCSARIGWLVSDVTRSNRYIEGSFCDDTHMAIENNGNSYKITLPTGTQISFYHITDNSSTTIGGITIKPSIADWQTSGGLCGFLDGNITNDFRTRDGGTTSDERTFALDWKITGQTGDVSMFGGASLPDINTMSPRYCKCRDRVAHGDVTTAECNLESATALCSGTGSDSFFKSCDETFRRKRSASEPLQRHRRAAGDGDVVAKFPIVLESDADLDPTPLSWRNGWDEQSATSACRQFLENQKFLQKCEEILPEMRNETTTGIQACVEDIKLIGDSRFMQSTADTLSESCRMTVVRLENLTMTSSPRTPGKSVLGEMLDLDCRNNCSSNGRCTNGSCECFDDFEGSDCSIRRSLPPIMSSRTNPGLCQSDVYACTTFYVSGSNFASENVTCRAVHLTIHESTYQLTSQNETFPAVPMSGGIGCSCSLPQSPRIRRSSHDNAAIAEGFFLSVSNDGVVFSDDVAIIVYNSTCFTCNTTSISCSVKSSCQSATPTLPTTSPSSGSVGTTLFTTQDDQHHGYINIGLVVGVVIGGLGSVVVVLLLTKLILVRVTSEKPQTVDLVHYNRRNS